MFGPTEEEDSSSDDEEDVSTIILNSVFDSDNNISLTFTQP